MKAPFLFPVLGFALFLTACQKEAPLLSDNSSDTFAPPPSERCGCMAPVASAVVKVTGVSAGLSWETMPEAIGYRVELTSSDFGAGEDTVTDMYIFETTENSHIALTNLSPDTRYQYRLTTICRVSESSVSDIKSFETKKSVHGDPGYYQPVAHKYGTTPLP
jgi:hypothetical protein